MAHLLPPSSETLFPNRMCLPAKMPRLARPMTTLLSGSMSFTDFISSAGSFPSPPTRRTTFLYISRARNDIFPLLYSSLHPLATTAAPAGGCLARFWCLGRQGDAVLDERGGEMLPTRLGARAAVLGSGPFVSVLDGPRV